MSEQSPSPPSAAKKKAPSDKQILFFILILCFVCGFLLALIAYSLQEPQTKAKEFDRSKQMLIAAKVLSPNGNFQLLQEDGTIQNAKFNDETKVLEPSDEEKPPKATDAQITEVASLRIRPLVTDAEGNVSTLEEKNIDLTEYLQNFKQTGYAKQENKLFYAILPNDADAEKLSADEVAKDISKAQVFVFPVSGFGLWAPIYGYLAIGPDGNSVVGTTWYEMAETPGLGANITEPTWQKQFYGKQVFLEQSGKVDYASAPLGITVVKGKVVDVYGSSSQSKSAVDGISGSTLTGNGVTAAYRDSLGPYRPLLIKIHDSGSKSGSTSSASNNNKPKGSKP